ncbi:2-acyl-glycerophospho-ethanolamine acyltransferase [Propionibacterium australiense]|uniref:Acyltransferase n=1 Tax=Propionibacterium australiense TaxID=119981 RepID=A0A383S4N7_9ACTN|nr:Acyltransferase [Propionibacterium australiense]VEH91173.1 2-acyl-glycerophospho-ethanolamine acyltransferase [Propionibacterium australiense]
MRPVLSAPASRPYRGRLGRANNEPTTRLFAALPPMASALLAPVCRLRYAGQENIPDTGPLVLAPNHLCSLDPVVVGHYTVYAGRWPHFLARANLFTAPGVGALLRGIEQIPVERGSARAAHSLVAARQMLDAGRAVVVYPEGTFTYDPDEWPMAGHTGAARLALATGAPVVPLGQWGANFIVPPRHKRRAHLIGRTEVTVRAGAAVDLSDLAGRGEHDRAAVREATVRIMDAICAQVELVRGEKAPAGRWHPGRGCRVPVEQAVR